MLSQNSMPSWISLLTNSEPSRSDQLSVGRLLSAAVPVTATRAFVGTFHTESTPWDTFQSCMKLEEAFGLEHGVTTAQSISVLVPLAPDNHQSRVGRCRESKENLH